MKGFVYFPLPDYLWPLFPEEGRQKNDDFSVPHITLFYFKEINSEQAELVSKICEAIASEIKPFEIVLAELKIFPSKDGLTPVYVSVEENLMLQSIYKAFQAAMTAVGLPFKSDFPTYVPHTTIDYIKDGEELPEFDVAGTKLFLNTIEFNVQEE